MPAYGNSFRPLLSIDIRYMYGFQLGYALHGIMLPSGPANSYRAIFMCIIDMADLSNRHILLRCHILRRCHIRLGLQGLEHRSGVSDL